MTHTTSDPLMHESLDETMDGSVEQKRSPVPQRSQKQWGLLLGSALLLVGGTWGVLQLTRSTHEPQTVAPPTIQVETILVQPKLMKRIQTLMGTVEPTETVVLTSRVMGQIRSLNVQEGDRVNKGQVIARIDVNDIQAQNNQATAAITQAQSGVSIAQAAAIQAYTAQTQAIAQANQAEARKQQAEGQRQQAVAELASALLSQQRMKMLRQEGAVSQAFLDEANTKVAVVQAQIQQVEATIKQAQRGIEQNQAAVTQAIAGITQAQEGVKQARAQVEQMQAQQQQTQANLEYGVVIAPFSGVVIHKHTEVGAIAGSGQPIVTLENTSNHRLTVNVPESLISQIHQGDRVQVKLDALNQTLTGSIHQIIPSAVPSSRSFTIKVALPQAQALISGLFGRLELPGQEREGILIPDSALVQRGQLQGVYVVDASIAPEKRAMLRWVKTAKTQTDGVEVVSGLAAGDRIITSSNIGQLSDGQPIAIRE